MKLKYRSDNNNIRLYASQSNMSGKEENLGSRFGMRNEGTL